MAYPTCDAQRIVNIYAEIYPDIPGKSIKYPNTHVTPSKIVRLNPPVIHFLQIQYYNLHSDQSFASMLNLI